MSNGVLPISKIVSREKLQKVFESIDFNTPNSINKLEESRSIYEKFVTYKDVTRASHIYKDDYNRIAQSISFRSSSSFVKFYVPINLYTVEDLHEERQAHIHGNTNSKQPRHGTRQTVSRVNQIRAMKANKVAYNYQGPSSIPVADNQHKLISNEKRGYMQRTNLEVYVNGTKIPDREVLLTPVNGTVDVYFESRHLKEEGNEVVFILKKNTPKKPYRVRYVRYNNQSNIFVDPTKQHNVYKNGKFLIPFKDYKIEGDQFIYNGKLMEGELIEILEVNYKCYFPTSYINNHTGIIYAEDLIDTEGNQFKHYNKAVSTGIVELYVDGLRYFSDKIDDLSATFFYIKDSFTNGKNVYYRVIFEDYENEDKHIDYLDAYNKATNFFAKRLVIDKLLNNTLDIELPEYFELGNMNENYSPEYLGNFIKDPLKLNKDKDEYLYGMIKKYIMSNSYYLKHVAEQFVVEPEKYTMVYDSTNVLDYVRYDTTQELPSKYYQTFDKSMIVFPFNCTIDRNTEFYTEKVYVNGRFINRGQYFLKTNDRNMLFLYVDSEIVTDGLGKRSKPKTTVDCYIERSKNNNVVKDTFVFDGNDNSRTKFIDLNYFNIDEERYSDLVVSVKYPGWDYYKQLEEEDYKLQLVLFDGRKQVKVKLLKNDLPVGTKVCTYNPYFIRREEYFLPDDVTSDVDNVYMMDLKDIFNDISETPIFAKGTDHPNVEIYYDGLRIFEGLDYRILLPSFDNRFESPKLLLRFEVKPNKRLTIINKDTNENIVSSTYKLTSKYGLLYLPDIKYPYSSDYMTVYVNGEIHSPDDIEFIANNFIRLHNVKSIYGVNILSTVDMPREIEDDLYNMSLLNKESFERYLERYIMNTDDPSSDSGLDDFFENSKDVVDKPEDEKDEILKPIDPELPDRFDRVDIGINSVIQSMLNGIIQKRIDANKPIEEDDILGNLFFDYFFDNIVRLDANERVLVISEDEKDQDIFEKTLNAIGLNANEHCYSNEEIAEIFAHEQIKNVQESIDGDLDVFKNSNMNKYIYPENDIILNANIEHKYTDQTVLDANDADMEEDGMQDHEFGDVIVFDSNI